MNLFFAGYPGGRHEDGEVELRKFTGKRLITYFYEYKAGISLRYFVGVTDGTPRVLRDKRSEEDGSGGERLHPQI